MILFLETSIKDSLFLFKNIYLSKETPVSL